MKHDGYTFTEDQDKMYIRLSMDQAVKAITPNGMTLELRPIAHYNNLDWGFAMFDNDKQVGPEFSVESPESAARLAKMLSQLHLAQ